MRITTLIFEYRCAVCWGMLTERDGKAICARYGVEHAGFHRISGIDWQRNHSDYDRQEVIRLYQDIKPFCYMLGLANRPTETISREQLARNNRILHGDDLGL